MRNLLVVSCIILCIGLFVSTYAAQRVVVAEEIYSET
jgi:hypothetical protein